MAEDNIVQRIKRWKAMSKRPIGRPKTRWEDDVFGRYKEHECAQLEESSTEQRQLEESGRASQNRIQVVAIYKKKNIVVGIKDKKEND